MWDKDDQASRWVQGLCVIPLVIWIVIACYLHSYLSLDLSSSSKELTAVDVSILVAGYIAVRCLWYAVTGRYSINRDDY